MKQWNEIFKKRGKVFLNPQEDMPEIAKIFKERGIKKVLDLGCGSGRHMVYLAKHGFEVYGIDIAPKGIEITKKWIKQEKLKANFKIGNIYKKLPYPNNFFDALISIHVMHHEKISNIRKLIKEIERILKPEGLVFIILHNGKGFKKWKKFKVITEGYNGETIRYKTIDPRTYVPIEGEEKGLIHFFFNKKIIIKEFNNFKIYNIWADSKNRHYCFLAELKR